MGLFSRPKCPMHGKEYSIGSNGLTEHYYCKDCYRKARKERDEKLSAQNEIDELKERIRKLESKSN